MFANSHLGYWSCGNDIYWAKAPAVLKATDTGLPVQWHFNDQAYSCVDWNHEPEIGLADLYRQRALQLREKYDYLVLLYSGGSDSTNVLMSFIDNNIKLDEIITARETTLDPQHAANAEMTNCGNWYISKAIEAGIKYSVVNYTDYLSKSFTDESWVLTSDMQLRPWAQLQVSALFDHNSINHRAEQGHKVCYLLGMEKPILLVEQNWYNLVFRDTIHSANAYQSVRDLDAWNGINVEYFYTTPDMIDIVRKQAHVVIKYLESSHDITTIKQILWKYNSIQDKFTWRNCILPEIIYGSNWHRLNFTLGKAAPRWDWFTSAQHLPQNTIYQQGINTFARSINAQNTVDSRKLMKPIFKSFAIRPCKPHA